MILYWIFINVILIIVNTFAILSAIIIPKYCFEDLENTWICNITSNNDQINCKVLEVISYSPKRTIQLKIKTIDSDRHLMLFEGAEKCNIDRLIIEANQIPSNRVIRNLKTLELLIIHSSQGYSSEKSINVANNLLNGLERLDKIKIENIKINLWNREIFQSCTKITEIDLKSLEIEMIDFQSFANCKKLRVLTIRLNKISRLIISSFNGLTDLTRLFLSNNGILEIITNGNRWEGLDQLKELDFSYNKITELIPRQFLGLNALEKVTFKNNNLKSIAIDTFLGLNELTSLNLQNNPRLITFDLNVFSPVKQTLTRLFIDTGNVQCIHDKRFLLEYRNGFQQDLQSIATCNPVDNKQRVFHTKSSVEQTSVVLQISTTHSNNQLTLIITVTILSAVICFLVFFLIYYCVISKSKIKKYKLNSRTNSCHYSRNDNMSHCMSEINNTTGRNYQNSDDTYAQFITQPTTRNEKQRSKSSMVTV